MSIMPVILVHTLLNQFRTGPMMGAVTLDITQLIIMTFSIMTLSLKGLM
jgi:hypothetical protein